MFRIKIVLFAKVRKQPGEILKRPQLLELYNYIQSFRQTNSCSATNRETGNHFYPPPKVYSRAQECSASKGLIYQHQSNLPSSTRGEVKNFSFLLRGQCQVEACCGFRPITLSLTEEWAYCCYVQSRLKLSCSFICPFTLSFCLFTGFSLSLSFSDSHLHSLCQRYA